MAFLSWSINYDSMLLDQIKSVMETELTETKVPSEDSHH
jgi:hypothetical protein